MFEKKNLIKIIYKYYGNYTATETIFRIDPKQTVAAIELNWIENKIDSQNVRNLDPKFKSISYRSIQIKQQPAMLHDIHTTH